MTKQQQSPETVQHSPGPLTGDMYTVPTKFEVKSPKSSHEYDTVEDTFKSMQLTTIAILLNCNVD